MPVRSFKPRPHLVGEGHPDAVLFEKFMELVMSRNRPGTFKNYRRILGGFRWFLEHEGLELRSLRTEHIDAFLKP